MSSANSEIDEAIKAALVHKLYLRTERWSEFVQLSLIEQRRVLIKQVKNWCHGAYTRFLHHSTI